MKPMKWKAAPEQLKSHLEQMLAGVDCEKKVMFGYPAYFINQYMFAGLFEDKLFIRLSE
jgi:TfoX/Sxy family transcriptional regulator of competence genes